MCMVSWIVIFIGQALDIDGPNVSKAIEDYGVLPAYILILIKLVSLLAFPQTLINFVSLFIYETFKDKVKLRASIQSAPFFVVRVVTRGLYPNLVERNLQKNLETIYSLGCENFAIEGCSTHF